MSDTKTFLPLGGNAQLDNEESSHYDYIRYSQVDRPISTRMSAAEIKAYGLVGGIAYAVTGGVLWFFQITNCWGLNEFTMTFRCQAATGMLWTYIGALPIAGLAAAGVALWSRVQRTRAEVERAGITRDRWSNPVSTKLIHQQSPEYLAKQFMASAQFELQAAPFKQYPTGLDALNISSPAAKPADAPALTDNGASVPPMAADEWLELLNDVDGEPHILLAGKTKAGKSTLAEVLLARRVERGDDIYIIDPHYQPVNKYGETTWGGLTGVGGDSWDSVRSAMRAVKKEYDTRKRLANLGQMPEGGFKPLTVLIDEVPEIYEALKEEWQAFAGVIGSGARKYNIFAILITQSYLIKDIGGSSAKRENFVIVALNEKAKALVLAEVVDAKEKSVMMETLRGQAWSGAMVYRNDVILLDRAGTREMRPKSLDYASVWSGPSESAENDLKTDSADQTDAADDTAERKAERVAHYTAIASSGVSRKNGSAIIRTRYGGFDNNLWTEVRKDIGVAD